ncbi:hypothetical protein T492DRAFT_266768 [Pavlovales sp. CCMP2436]|nr:hypothetical protein T492DRAFT_266768 [Pavlovales sp. CCMP2436]
MTDKTNSFKRTGEAACQPSNRRSLSPVSLASSSTGFSIGRGVPVRPLGYWHAAPRTADAPAEATLTKSLRPTGACEPPIRRESELLSPPPHEEDCKSHASAMDSPPPSIHSIGMKMRASIHNVRMKVPGGAHRCTPLTSLGGHPMVKSVWPRRLSE